MIISRGRSNLDFVEFARSITNTVIDKWTCRESLKMAIINITDFTQFLRIMISVRND